MLLADAGFYFTLSRLINSSEQHQYMQVLFILAGGHHTVHLEALPKLLRLPDLVSYVDINDLVTAVHKAGPWHAQVHTLKTFFHDFQRDPARSGEFHHYPAKWHAFAATRFLRFVSTASSQ